MSDEKVITVDPKTGKRRQRGWRDADGPTGGAILASAVPASRRQIALVGALLMTTALILFYFLFKAWPPTPWPTDEVTKKNLLDVITFFARFPSLRVDIHTSLDERLIFLVIVAGALGSYIHAATSFADYVGNRKLANSWLWWYILRPFIGVALALVFYFVVRAGFLTGGAGDVNPYGVATLGALAGMFSKQATDKLEEVFTTIFRPAPGKGDAKRGDKLGAPTVSGMTPKEGPSAGGTEVTISGTGYVDKPSVTFGGTPATSVAFTNATTIKATTPKHDPGMVEVVITNPDGQEGSPKESFTYLPDGAAGSTGAPGVSDGQGAPAGNAGTQAVDELDGHDAEIKADTPDEHLPITEGGVE
jgi:hypothetical protein